MAAPALIGVPAAGLQQPLGFPLSAVGPVGPLGPLGPLWWTLLLTQLPADAAATTTTTTAKPTTASGPSIVVLPLPAYPGFPGYPGYPPPGGVAPAPPPGACNVNCPAVWEPLCSVNGPGLLYNFPNLCAMQAQNCVGGSDFRFLYAGLCKVKR